MKKKIQKYLEVYATFCILLILGKSVDGLQTICAKFINDTVYEVKY
jgi:hypothetical protein